MCSLSVIGNVSVYAQSEKSITWLVPQDPLIDKYADVVVKAYEKLHPNVKIDVISPSSTAAYPQKLLTLVASGQTPDIFTDWGGTGVYTIATHGLAANLIPYFKEEKVSPNYIPLSYRKEFEYQGQLIGVPWNSNPTFLVYNKDLFKKYHVPLPPVSWNDKSWTLASLLRDAKMLTHDTSNPKSGTWGVIMQAGSVGSLAWLWGGDPFNDRGGPQYTAAYHGAPLTHTFANSPKMVAAMTWASNVINKWHVSPSPGIVTALSTLGNPFFTGRVGIVEVQGGWLNRQAAVAKPKFPWAIAPLPYGPGGVDYNQREDNAYYLAKTSKHPKTAFNFMLFATTGWGAKQLINIAKDNPPSINRADFNLWSSQVMKIPGLSMNRQQFEAVFQGGLVRDYPDPTNLVNNSANLGNAFTQITSPLFLGKSTAKEVLDSLQNAWKQYLQ